MAVDSRVKSDVTWVSDLVVKALCGAATVLLGVAVHSLQSMSSDIRDLSKSVYELSTQTRVIDVTVVGIQSRLEMLETNAEQCRVKK